MNFQSLFIYRKMNETTRSPWKRIETDRKKKNSTEILYELEFVCIFFISFCLGEHPAAMQRGCANANIDMSIVVYIITLSMLLQQVNRITHGYGVSYDVIRWFKSITPKTMAPPFYCSNEQQQQLRHQKLRNAADYLTSNCPNEWSYRMLATDESPCAGNNTDLLCIVRWNPVTKEYW